MCDKVVLELKTGRVFNCSDWSSWITSWFGFSPHNSPKPKDFISIHEEEQQKPDI